MTAAAPAESASGPVPLEAVEKELAARLKGLQQGGQAPVVRACLSNLVIFCSSEEAAAEVAAAVPQVVTIHPARVLLLVGVPGGGAGEVAASVSVRSHRGASGHRVFSEQVTLRADGRAVERLPFAVRPLLTADLPVNLWWAVPAPPVQAGPLLYDLLDGVQQVIYDSRGWAEPARGVVATAAWLAAFERPADRGRWRIAADLNWRRLKYWRRLLTQALDPATAPGALASVRDVTVEHGPHAVVQAWQLVSWLASRLGWRVRAGAVQPGVEIDWHFAAGPRTVAVRLRRLAEGPAEIVRVRVATTLDGQDGAFDLTLEGDRRLSASPEGIGPAAPRTLTVQVQPLAELVARQLSDREDDPVFDESMAVAGVLARSVLGG
jgi:glucose-6-phosphate dehydrogenase assembly protein OpcA